MKYILQSAFDTVNTGFAKNSIRILLPCPAIFLFSGKPYNYLPHAVNKGFYDNQDEVRLAGYAGSAVVSISCSSEENTIMNKRKTK